MKMRKYILATATAGAMALGMGGVAQAQIAVIDPAAIAKQIEQLAQLQQQYQALMQQYEAIAHLPEQALNEVGSQLNTQQFRDPLSAGSIDVGSIMSGTGTGSGSLSSDVQTYLNQNRVYQPTGNDFQAQEMRRSATSIAGSQAMAAKLYQSAATHIQTLQSLEGQLRGAPDAKAVADVQARIGMEQAAFQAQQVQAQSLAMWQSAQERSEEQRRAEQRHKEIDALLQEGRSQGY